MNRTRAKSTKINMSLGLLLMSFFYCAVYFKFFKYTDFHLSAFGKLDVSMTSLQAGALITSIVYYIRFLINAFRYPERLVMLTSDLETVPISKEMAQVASSVEKIEKKERSERISTDNLVTMSDIKSGSAGGKVNDTENGKDSDESKDDRVKSKLVNDEGEGGSSVLNVSLQLALSGKSKVIPVGETKN